MHKYYKVIENYLGMRIYGQWYLQFFEIEIDASKQKKDEEKLSMKHDWNL